MSFFIKLLFAYILAHTTCIIKYISLLYFLSILQLVAAIKWQIQKEEEEEKKISDKI